MSDDSFELEEFEKEFDLVGNVSYTLPESKDVFISLSIGDCYGERRLKFCLSDKHLFLFEKEVQEMALILNDFAHNKGFFFEKVIDPSIQFKNEYHDLVKHAISQYKNGLPKNMVENYEKKKLKFFKKWEPKNESR